MEQTFAKTKTNTNILDLAGAAQRILEHWQRQKEQRSRVYRSCNFHFKPDGLSSSQPALLTGFVLRSEVIWIRLLHWQILLRYMNINVTSERAEQQTEEYQFTITSVSVQTISLWIDLFSPRSSNREGSSVSRLHIHHPWSHGHQKL